MKFSKHRATWLVMPLVGVLVSCGGEGDQAPQPQTREVELRIIDGYLHRASVWLDSNGNGKIDPGEPQTRSDEQGRARLSMPAQAVGMVMARAIAGQTRDLDEPDRTVARDFLMMAPADSRLVTPFTTYLALQQREGRSPEEALSRLRHELTQPSLDPTQDYVARPEPVIAASARALAQLLPATAQQLTEQGGMLLSQGASAIGADLLNQQQSGQSIVTGHWHFTVQEGAPVLGARDRDGDGTLDADDAFPDDKSESQDSDKDGIGDNADPDDDNDGWPDADELRLGSDPLSATSQPADRDGDKIADAQDPDRDGDGVNNEADAFPDDKSESQDSDKDGIGDNADPDDDNDGWLDADELRLGSDPLSATSHPAEQGGNNNGVDPLPDETGQSQLPDQDGDGVPDQQDAFPLDRFETRDSNGDGWGDRASSDDDGDGIPDSQDPTPTGSTAQVPHYDEAVIHYRRVDGNYDGWGIHLWNDPRCDSVVTSTGWAQPQAPVGGAGPDGIAFRIPIKPGHGACVNFLIHKGEVRAWGGDGNLDLSRGNVAYTFDGNPSLYYQPQRELPVAVTGAAAHWLSLDTLAWSAPPGADHYELWAGEGELAQPERFQRLVLGAGGQLTDERFPHLKGRSRFTLSATAEQARAMLKQSLLAVAVDAEGKAMAATQVQTPFVIDALYTRGDNDADEARLGAWMEGGASHFRLWAPTARKVALYLYDAQKRPLPQSPVAMTEDAGSGIWAFDGAASLEGSFYRYEIEAYHYKSGKLERMTTTDPYSVSLSTASRFSQLVDLEGGQAKPVGWDAQSVPPLAKPEDSIIYELHIRDFSNSDKGGTPSYNGKYLAFTEGARASVQHLKLLREAGLNTIHLLPSFDLSSVEEEAARRMDLDDDVSKLCDPAKGLNPKAALCARAGSGTLRSLLEGLDPASGDVQALLAEIRPRDGFNWGYDPYHYNAPEGSYAVESDGLPRIREYRSMVQALHQMGFRVVQDVVFNHTSSSSLYNTSVLDKVVPGYYHRRNPDNGLVESSTCCDNTASEHRMFEKLVADSLVSWATEYKIDGFRFDLMGHLMKSSVVKAFDAVKRVDGDTWFYGEGWDFGEVQNNARGVNSSQWNMAGTGIGTYNDRLRDAVRGDHSDPMNGTPGLANAGDRFDAMGNKMDLIRLGMAANLQTYPLPTDGGTVLGRDYQFGGHGAGYAADPQETVNYVSKHDNQTLWDINQYKAKGEVSPQDRARMQIVGLAPVLLGQGVPFLHMGSELLRSKSMERDSYDSGDWFNRVYFSKQGNNWNVGLPRQDKDGSNWEWIGRIIANPNTRVGPAEIAWSDARFRELLAIRAGSELLRLGETDQILKRVRFHAIGSQARPGTIVMTVDDGVAAGADLDPANQALAVAINGSIWEQRVPIPGADGFVLHPVLAAGGDERLHAARVEKGELVIPGLSVVVFAKPQQGEQGAGMDVGGEPLFLRGSFSKTPWDASTPMIYKGAGVYESSLTLAAGSHELKVASGDWDPQFGAGNLIAGFGSLPWRNVSGNVQIEAPASGTYRFTLSLANPAQPRLTITAPDAPPLVPPPYGDEALYLRGTLTDWQSGAALTYVGNGKYGASVYLQPGEYRFKIASDDWTRVRLQFGDLSAPEGGLTLLDAGDDGQILIRVTGAGLYRFVLDAHDPQSKTLSVTTDASPTPANGVMMQYFHWYNTQEDNLWLKVADEASTLAAKGVTALWLPPASKAMIRPDGSLDVGYATYDLYDLGEFNQQGSVRTRYGDKEQYLAAIERAHRAGIQVYGDVVLNHKFGADQTETVTAVRVEGSNRNQEYGSDGEISAWTRFDFPGRGDTYSDFKWRWYHFDGVDWDAGKQEKAIFKFRGLGKGWDGEVSGEFGNYDYLMGADLDMDHPEVVEELKRWGRWYVNTASLDGFRLDAVKHIKASFFKEWLDGVRGSTGKGLFTVGEYWDYDRAKLQGYLKATGYRMALFDAPLHLNFHNASRGNGDFDMGSLLNGTLMQSNPAHAVTLVENHDTQPLQMLESPVLDWFKPLAYSFILLRQEGYPNLFYADYYGASYRDKGRDGQEHDIRIASQQGVIDTLLQVRRDQAYGTQRSYLNDRDVIGWTREGDSAHPRGVAVLMTDNGYEGRKWMEMGPAHRNRCFQDVTGHYGDRVCANGDGWAEFKTKPGAVSVWVGEAP